MSRLPGARTTLGQNSGSDEISGSTSRLAVTSQTSSPGPIFLSSWSGFRKRSRSSWASAAVAPRTRACIGSPGTALASKYANEFACGEERFGLAAEGMFHEQIAGLQMADDPDDEALAERTARELPESTYARLLLRLLRASPGIARRLDAEFQSSAK
jgi:hypothetical protein